MHTFFKYLVACILLGLPYFAKSQADYLPGYLVFENGDSLSANLRTDFLRSVQRNKLWIQQGHNAPSLQSLDGLKALGLHGGGRMIRESVTLPDTDEPAQVWGRVLASGATWVIQVTVNEQGSNLLYAGKGGQPLLLISGLSAPEQPGGGKVSRQQQIQLRNIFGDCSDMFTLLENQPRINSGSLKQLAQAYNDQCQSQIPGYIEKRPKGAALVKIRILPEYVLGANLLGEDVFSKWQS